MEIEQRLSIVNDRLIEIRNTCDRPDADLDALTAEAHTLMEEHRDLKKQVAEIEYFNSEKRRKAIEFGLSGGGTLVERSPEQREQRSNNMEYKEQNNDLEVRAFQKYILGHQMDETEKRALAIAGAAAVLPVTIMNQLITSEKYSDLLYRATVINEPNAGTLQIPVASNTAAAWKTENSDIGLEASPTLTNISLGGYELMRLMQVSAATMNRSTAEFQEMMMNLLSAEVIETLEASFCIGVGATMPLGLDNLTWNGTNEILTANAATKISPDNIAAAIGLLPQKYARNAIMLVNAQTLYDIASYSDADGNYIFAAGEATTRFMGKEIVVNEHVLDDEIYIFDPKQLYVRFSMPITVQADTSAGFTSASVFMRALCVVDAKFNPAACVRVGLGA